MKYDKLLRHSNKFCLLSYFAGIALFIFFNHEDQSEHCYFSENALLPGLVQLEHHLSQRKIYSYSEKCSLKNNNDSYHTLRTLLEDKGLEVYEQSFQYQSNFVSPQKNLINGVNIYAIIRASRSASTESIVINVPLSKDQHNHASGVVAAFGELARNEIFWAKDIIILFSRHGSYGLRAWLDVYHGLSSVHINADQLPARAGSIQAAVILELPEKEISYINLKLEGRNGQLPNLDLVNVAVRLSKMGGIPIAINHQFSPYGSSQYENLEQYLATSMSMMKQLAKGKSSGNHGEFLIYNIPAITMQGVGDRHNLVANLVGIERLLNGICRSLNNLLERFHQSFFFYFLPANDRYISISMFMPCFGLVLLPAVVKALALIIAKNIESKEESESTGEKDGNEELEKLLSESNSKFARSSEVKDDLEPPVWYEVMLLVGGSHLTALMLYYSPNFTSVWAEMFEMQHEMCFVLLHLFVCLLGMFFISSLNISFAAANAIRITTLLQLSIVLGTLSITNFSLGYISSIFMVPPAMLVSPREGRFAFLNKIVVFLASPVLASFFLFETVDQFVEVYNWHVTNESMLYPVFALLYFPLWLQLWGITTAAPQLQTIESKEKKE